MSGVNLYEIAKIYREWGFTPLPVRDNLKFPGHLRIRQHSLESLIEISRTTSFAGATGIWLLLHEPPRDDSYVHVALDFDELPATSDWSPERQRAFRDRVWNTFAYYTARGIHAHFLVPRDQIPASFTSRVRKVYAGKDGRHVADVFIFAPADDPQFKTSWRQGVLVYPSIAVNNAGERVQRRLVSDQLIPPAKITWDEFEDLLRVVYGDFKYDASSSSAVPTNISLAYFQGVTVSGTVSKDLAGVLRTLHAYACVSEVLPMVNSAGKITAPPSRVVKEGSRNNALMAILSVAARVATPHVDVMTELAQLVNRYTMDPPLSDAEVLRVLQSVVGGGYEMRPRTFAERMGLTDHCALCPMHTLCYADDIVEAEVPEFEEIPADSHFPSDYFRGQQQQELYHQLVDAISRYDNRIVLGLAPTGSGKTLHATGLASIAVKERNTSVVVLVPTKQLQNQHGRWLINASLPHVLFKGRSNFSCPLLNLLRTNAQQRYGGEVVDGSADWSAASAPCAIGVSCRTYLWAKRALKKEDLSGDDLHRAVSVVEDFEAALRASIIEHFTTFVTFGEEVLDGYVAESASACPYLKMLDDVRHYLARNPPGVIVANRALLFVARRAARAGANMKHPTIIILDEAHKLIDSLFKSFRLWYVDPQEVSAVDGALEALEVERQRAEADLQELKAKLDYLSTKKNVSKKEISKIRRRIDSVKRHLQNVDEMRILVSIAPSSFVPDPDPRDHKVYIRVLKNRRAQILREYLLREFPNTQFILLTATGSELTPIADVVVRADDVIPIKNRQIIYLPVMRLSARNLKDRVRKVYQTIVVPHILAQYAAIAPLLAKTYKVEAVRGIIHEVSKERAVILARALADVGYKILLYAGKREDLEDDSFQKKVGADLDLLRRSENVTITTSLEDAVGEFKRNKQYTFLVAVALDTGHDFDEDDIMLQWIVKVPYQPLKDSDYVLILKNEGKDARDKQYTYDTLMQLIQAAGRTTRKPEQYSMTIVLDALLPSLLSRAWYFGFEEDVLDIAKRLVVPARYAGHFAGLPAQVQQAITVIE